MAKLDFYSLGRVEKEDIFNAIATDMGMTPFAVEKDWWVSRTLHIIFQMDIAAHMVFKGGTSLSKAWKLIQRLSEDIDLAIDPAFFLGYHGTLTRAQIGKLRKEAGRYTAGIFFEDLQEAFRARGFQGLSFQVIDTGESDQDPRIIEIHYPNIIPQATGYVSPRVQIEVSCRSLREPFSLQRFGALVDEHFADMDFAEPLFDVPAVDPERTLLEKLFLLHEEFHRPTAKRRVDRLSRHLYDIFHLTRAGIAERAIQDKELYETIVSHRYKYARIGEVDYNLHHPRSLNPIPVADAMAAWRADYATMREQMIYEDDKPSFEDLIHTLKMLISQCQSVAWSFDLTFPVPRA
jgi:predicted nucleotidyltransferase component of viral defense system